MSKHDNGSEQQTYYFLPMLHMRSLLYSQVLSDCDDTA